MDDQQALFKAIQEGDIAAVEQLLADDSSLMYAKNENGVSALMFAVYYRERKIVDLLLGQGIQTTIFEAAALGQSERVAALLDEDATLLDAFSDDGFAPLGLAAFFGHADTAALLLRNGADPDLPARNPMQVRPIHSAVANRDAQVGYKIARMLLEHGAEVNVAQHGGWTPLHQAAAHGQDEVIELLLQYGADRSETSDDGKTPLDMARENGHKSTITLLEG